ncbi:MAG: LacI family DNA-binding transcriptional regulator [Pseudomonadota bacterium]|nr:LacI family DNA-binding transcriptional regulator [Pseudomonadota bacterium]MEC8581652.1 LacI family DNA-binding transcriptional regulator [Pseudomonadota bacterium]
MARKPTITDLARECGLGPATVDRVLHERPNVSDRARDLVAQAAARLGYPVPATLALHSRADLPKLTLGFVLHKQGQSFYQDFAREIEKACQARSDVSITPHIRFSPSQSPEDFVREMTAAAKQCDAIAATAVNHTSTARVTEDLMKQGLPVFSALNDFARSAGAGYFGMDNMKVGRIAASVMAMRHQRDCTVGVMIGGTRWHGQAMRETGFRTYLREYAPQIQVLDTLVNLETRQLTYEATLDLLNRVPDLAGMYVAGGGMEGAIAAVREARPPNKIALIVNELTPESRSALADRYLTLVVATPLEKLCQRLIDSMVQRIQEPEQKPSIPAMLEPLLYLPESI